MIFKNLQARRMRKPGVEGKICVVVGTITDDVRLVEVPKLKVSILKIMSLGLRMALIM